MKELLLNRGIDPYFGKENLVYAPNQGHPAKAMKDILAALKLPNNKPKSKQKMAEALQEKAFTRQLPDM